MHKPQVLNSRQSKHHPYFLFLAGGVALPTFHMEQCQLWDKHCGRQMLDHQKCLLCFSIHFIFSLNYFIKLQHQNNYIFLTHQGSDLFNSFFTSFLYRKIMQFMYLFSTNKFQLEQNCPCTECVLEIHCKGLKLQYDEVYNETSNKCQECTKKETRFPQKNQDTCLQSRRHSTWVMRR